MIYIIRFKSQNRFYLDRDFTEKELREYESILKAKKIDEIPTDNYKFYLFEPIEEKAN